MGVAYEAISGFLLVAYIVRRISPAEYGLLLLAISVTGLAYLLDLGLSNLLVQAYVAAAKQSLEKVSALLSTAFFTLTACGSLAVIAFLALAFHLPGPFQIPRQYLREASIVFLLAAVAVLASLPATALEYAYQAFHRFDRINQEQCAIATIRVVLVVALLSKGHGVVALAAVYAVVSLLRVLLLWVGLPWSVAGLRLGLRRFQWSLLRPLLRPGGWAALDNCTRQFASFSDSLILGVFGSLGSVALFGIGSKLPKHLSNLVTKGAIVILPSLSESHVDADQQQIRRVYLDTQKLVFAGVLPVVVLGFVCARPLVQLWAGNTYLGAAAVMQWLLLAAFSLAMEYPSDLLLYARGEIKTAAIISTCESLANVALSIVLVFRYGAVGLAAGTALTHILISALWYTPAACRAAGISATELLQAITRGHEWPMLLLAVELVVLGLARPSLTAWELLGVAAVCGIAYLMAWWFKAARFRSRLRVGAAGLTS